jgi:protein-S-isoprenylcysteine O-methyltransferase Ste14
MIIAPGEKVFGALLAIAGAVIIFTGHWATTDDMIADLIAGLLMLAFGVTVLLMWSFQEMETQWARAKPPEQRDGNIG